MIRSLGKEPNLDLRPLIEVIGWQTFIELVGVKKIIDTIIDHYGVQKIIDTIGIAREMNTIREYWPAELEKLKRRLDLIVPDEPDVVLVRDEARLSSNKETRYG
jgi:hypothetical protein